MPGRSEITSALSRLCLTAVTSSDPPAGAGAVGGTVDAWGFGWLPDGAGAGFPVARGITFLSWAGTSGDPGALDSAHFRHHDDISAELFATPFEDGHKAEVWAATLETIVLARRLGPRLEEDALIVCAGGDGWRGEMIAGLLPEARVVTILGALGSEDFMDLSHVDYWLPFGRRCANHDIAVIDDVSDLGFAHGQASAVCLFDSRADTHAWAALCTEGGVLCAPGADVSEEVACDLWVLEEMAEDALPGPGDSDLAAARLLISPLKDIDLNRALATAPGGTEEVLSTVEVELLYFGARGWSLTETAQWTSHTIDEITAAAARLSGLEICAVTPSSGALARCHRHLCVGEQHPPPETCVLPLVWRSAVERVPDHPAIELYDGTELTYAEMDRLIARARVAMVELGLSKGDRVGFWSGPCLEASVLFWAATAQGCVWVLLDPFAPAGATAGRAAELGLKHVYVERGLGEGASFPMPVTLFDLTTEADETGVADPGAPLLADAAHAQVTPLPDPHIGPFDPATIGMTSGTTAGGKAMRFTHFAVVRNVSVPAQVLLRAGIKNLYIYELRAGVTHDSLMAQIIQTVALDGMHILAYLPGSATFFETWNRINRTKANYFIGSQAFMRQLGMALDLKDFVVPENLKILHTAGPLPAALRARIANASSWLYVYTYGMTELVNICSTERHITTLSGDNLVGTPLDGIIQIRSEDGEVVANGPGEIWVTSDRCYDGYITPSGLDRSAKTGVWHRTGDLGRLDAEGNLYVMGRIDDMINIESGRTVSPDAIEEILERDDRVASSAILPCSDRHGGTRLFAFIGAPGIADEKEIREVLVQLIRAEAGEEFVPYRWSFVDEIPATSRGKVDKRALAALMPDDLKPEKLG